MEAVRNIQQRQKLTFRRGAPNPSPPFVKSSREPALLGELVREQVEKLGLGKKIKERQALLVYKEVVGEKIAAVSEATDIQGGKLFVKVNSPAWKEELMFTRHQIAEKINRKLEADVVKQVFLT